MNVYVWIVHAYECVCVRACVVQYMHKNVRACALYWMHMSVWMCVPWQRLDTDMWVFTSFFCDDLAKWGLQGLSLWWPPPLQPCLTVCFVFSFFFFPKIYLFTVYTVFCLHACLHQKKAPDLITDDHVPPWGGWELNSGPLEEQSMLLTSEPSL